MRMTEIEPYLTKSSYKNEDIRSLEGCCRNTATKIMNICRAKYGGLVSGRAAITTESYWLYKGSSLNEMIRRVALFKESSYATTTEN